MTNGNNDQGKGKSGSKQELAKLRRRAVGGGIIAVLAIAANFIPRGNPPVQKHTVILKDTLVVENGSRRIECIGDPDTTYVKPGDIIRFYTALDSAIVKGADSSGVWVGLRVRPEGKPGGNPLTNRGRFVIRGGQSPLGARISPKAAKGTYEIKVECGGAPDDPPKVVVW